MKHSIAVFLFCLIANLISSQCLITGADLSYVNTIEQNGGDYRNANGESVDPYVYFAEQGMDMVRLRLWHTPENITDNCNNAITSSNLEDVLNAATRTKAAGMQIKLTIHYGDYFVDPGKQLMPNAWQGLSHAILLDSIYQYTFDVVEKLILQNTPPHLVSIGNETNWGFIDATATTNGFTWPQTAQKFNAAFDAIDAINLAHNLEIKKAIHLTESAAAWGIDLFKTNGIQNYDVIGLSYYPNFSPDIDLTELGQLIKSLNDTYDKEVMIFETGFAWTNSSADSYNNFVGNNGTVLPYPTSAQGQKDFLFDLAQTVIDNEGVGVLYWEPAWITSSMCDQWGQGSSYENVSLFNFNNNNTALPAFDFFDYCNITPTENIIYSKIVIYPNPSLDSTLKIETDLLLTDWKLYNAAGQLMEEGKILEGKTIDLRSNYDGIFFLHFSIKNGNSIIKKLVF